MSTRRRRWPARRGSALLAVLWLSAALAAIAFSLSTTVRGETDRAATSSDGLQAYYLASGAIERAYLKMLWQNNGSQAAPPTIVRSGTTRLEFPEGFADVEVIPESSKLNLNGERPEVLFRLMAALGVDPGPAREIVLAIEDWRRPVPPDAFTQFDQYYLTRVPSFRARHASFQETEELLQVKGVTPDLYYGTWLPNPNAAGSEPRLMRRTGLADCLSIFGTPSVDINVARPEVLQAIGLPPDLVYAVVARRRLAPITSAQLAQLMQSAGPAGARLRIGAEGTIFTVRATARLRLPNGQFSDLKRTAAALVKFMPPGYDAAIHILRWYDSAWSN